MEADSVTHLDVILGVDKIRDAGDDYDVAHHHEDELLWKLIRAAAAGQDIRELARNFVEMTKRFEDDPRWCA